METAATLVTACALIALLAGVLMHSAALAGVGALTLCIGALLLSLHDLRGRNQ